MEWAQVKTMHQIFGCRFPQKSTRGHLGTRVSVEGPIGVGLHDCFIRRLRMERCDEDCATPKRRECQIPEAFLCPPAPRKKPVGDQKKRDPPKNGYFQPPDLDSLFAMPQICA
ncbi:hypothetical protein M0R45_029193 [Rubus argutus]|uniref:Uncharacterized protein n=1 Tax=Rubus argutus TaxID=59490 RepID=A0AAW1W9J9_RUBAR